MSNHHKFVKSDSMHHCDYDDATSTLKIKFTSSDKEHEYPNCPKEIYDGLKAALSPGRYFHQSIRNSFKAKP